MILKCREDLQIWQTGIQILYNLTLCAHLANSTIFLFLAEFPLTIRKIWTRMFFSSKSLGHMGVTLAHLKQQNQRVRGICMTSTEESIFYSSFLSQRRNCNRTNQHTFSKCQTLRFGNFLQETKHSRL